MNWKFLIIPCGVASCLFLARVTAQGLPLCPVPKNRAPLLISTITRSQLGFTEGLVWQQGKLYESTGAFGGPSTINQIDPASGLVSTLLTTPNNAFGEGLTHIENHFVQLTWQNRTVFVYDLNFQLKSTIPFSKEGWGLTNDGKNLIFGDGSNHLYVVDPMNLDARRTITVQDRDGNLYEKLNALSYANPAVYSNVFQTDQVLKIDANSGCVLTRYDLSVLRSEFNSRDQSEIDKDPSNNVLNGIAFDPDDQTFYVTGKNWWKIFKVILPD